MIAYLEPQKLTNKSDPGKYRYSDYGTGFDHAHNFCQSVNGIKMLLFLP